MQEMRYFYMTNESCATGMFNAKSVSFLTKIKDCFFLIKNIEE